MVLSCFAKNIHVEKRKKNVIDVNLSFPVSVTQTAAHSLWRLLTGIAMASVPSVGCLLAKNQYYRSK